ncbi:RNA-binding protein YlmH [Natranaerovirga pectinivora]|uniref:RNA-binding protein YlmH n=1 Tax=Natranaerovirga pectinivora TaxID=682400 RepID=A0A4R3MPP6_9FIRM|nr:YlmH/Sll1252 family protein [Natranaerovirga pectinivora]TCT14952.1 RNA-binding protein YlmH [Natranaerovirga pectinivora]
MNKEEQIVINRLRDLASICHNKNIPTFSDFLNLNEQNLLSWVKEETQNINVSLDGGYKYAERKMIVFYPNHYDEKELYAPYACLKIKPSSPKFKDELNHRDYLGAILSLGIDRSKIGDIIINDSEAFVFCTEGISNYIKDNFFEIKRTSIEIDIIYDLNEVEFSPKFKTISGSVSSIRLDTVIALGFTKSRGQMTPLIQGGKVFVNGKLIQSNSYILKENDIVSVRGLGKIIYREVKQQTKKGRNYIIIDRFI